MKNVNLVEIELDSNGIIRSFESIIEGVKYHYNLYEKNFMATDKMRKEFVDYCLSMIEFAEEDIKNIKVCLKNFKEPNK